MISVIVLGVLAIALFLLFWLKLRYRGKQLVYATAVIIFTFATLLLLIHHEMVFQLIENHFGTWGSIGIILAFCLVFWLIMKVLF